MVNSPTLRAVGSTVRRFALLPVVFAAVLVLSACSKSAPPAPANPNDPAFIVASGGTGTGTWTISRSDLDKAVDGALAENNATRDQVTPKQLLPFESKVLRYLVVKKLLLEKAVTMKLPDVDKEVDQAIEVTKNRNPGHTYTDSELNDMLKSHGSSLEEWKANLHEMATMQAVLDAGVGNTDPTDQEVNQIYEANKSAFNVPPMIRASRVLVVVQPTDTPAQKLEKKKKVEAARARVVKGEDFSKVAMEVSEDQSTKNKGGDMGKFPRGVNVPGFDDVVFKLKLNQLSPVFSDTMGYQFVKVTDISPAGVISLAEARAIIIPKLKDMKKQQAESAYAQNLLKNSGATFYLKDLDPVAQMNATNAPGNAEPGDANAPDQAGGGAPPPAPDQGPAPAPDQSPAPPWADLASPNLSATNAPGSTNGPSM